MPKRTEETGPSATAAEPTIETFFPEGAEPEPTPRLGEDAAPTEEPVTKAAGPRNPELCVVYHPGARRFTLERGSNIEEEGKVTGLQVPEGALDALSALASIEALRLAEIARRHDRVVIRVEKVGSGPLVAAALREAGEFHVVEFV